MMTPYPDPDALVDAILAQYPDMNSDDEYRRTRAASQALTDFFFGAPGHLQANFHLQ